MCIVFMFRMLQTFMAEKLNDHGFGRQTFALEVDLYRKRPPCLIFESQLSVNEVHKMTGTELWTYFARELMSSELFKEDRDQCKWFAFMSFTRYYVPPSTNPPSSHSEVVSLTKGHTALGMYSMCLCTATELWFDLINSKNSYQNIFFILHHLSHLHDGWSGDRGIKFGRYINYSKSEHMDYNVCLKGRSHMTNFKF